MKRKRAGVPVLLACAAIAMALQPVSAMAATCEKWAGKVVSAQGIVEVKPAGQTQWQAVKLNETYCPGDTIRTDRKSRADIALSNHPVLRLDQSSTVTLGGMKDDRTAIVDLLSGAALFFSRVTRNLEVRTATVNAGVEGTEFFLRVEEGKTDLTVFEGKVLAANAAGTLPVTTGQSAVAEAGKAPVYRVVVRPRDAVQWALYYPPVVDPRPSGIREESNDPRFFTHRASQRLAVGRVDDANADIARALALDPKNSDAFALQSIIAVTLNEKGKALDLARKAVASDPKSATARIALSYAQQAHFDLPGALASLNDAVKLEPGNALAWARLAELQQSFGYLDKSLDAARKAAGLNPDLSRTQTVLGFSHLTRVETREAREAFERAIRLDDADPLPRMGLGLAKIRDGHLEEGRREIEIAMSLDPGNALIRSYLGKAYYEEKREKLAAGQYGMAKTLDPSDPTPYFYDAILKQTANRPVEALQDVQEAIRRNDNRAVYRSRLLLDQDLAARSAGLARIYGDLGFQSMALIEGWKSVNTDPANFSAHRFLSDSYSVLPRHEIARVSELLQSQLLQPINISPVQPRIAESSLFVVSGGGPASLSFNEFNPLFERNRLALEASGIVGENSTAGEEIVVSGIHNKLSLSAGQYYYKTDGFRPNDDVKDEIYNVFAQGSITPKTSIQAEYRHRKTEKGDLLLRFFEDEYLAGERINNKSDTVRLGFHHAFSPGSDLLGSAMYQKADRSDRIPLSFVDTSGEFPVIIDVNLGSPQSGDDKAYSGELSHLYSSERLKVVSGAGYFKVDSSDLFSQETIVTDPADPSVPLFYDFFTTPVPRNIRHTNLYLYSHLNVLKNMTLTAGVSADFNKRQLPDSSYVNDKQYNPKFGFTWNPVPDTTIRAAAFRVLKRTLITNQTLEPTQVAGFNQFFDDINGTKAWRYGVAADQKFSQSLFGGAEYATRDLQVPILDLTGASPVENKVGWHEKTGRAYLYWTPHRMVALNAEYSYARDDRDANLNLNVKTLETHRIPLGINGFHPCGLTAMFKMTHYRQQGNFNRLMDPSDVFTSGSDRFWLTDAAIGYRLPQRYGIVSVGAKNLFDKSFKYFDTDFHNPSIQPGRMFFAKVTLSI